MWMGARAQLDPRPGGHFRIDVDGTHFASCEYREVEPPHRVVMSWGWESDPNVPPGSTTVEITLTEDGDGTLLRLRHSGLPSDASRSTHKNGWVMYTGHLRTLVGAGGS
jgi:uncharacterized protein YndB with AHSA1/START domain